MGSDGHRHARPVGRDVPRHQRAHPAPVGRGGRPAQGLRHLRRRRSEAAARARADRSQGAGADVPGAPGAVRHRSREELGPERGRLRVERLLRRRRRQGLPAVRGAAGGRERDRLRRLAAVGAEARLQRDAGRRGDRAALRSRAGRRVPGHQQRAVPAGAPAVAAHEQHHRRRRRGPVDLPLARRRHPQHPRLRDRPPGRAGREAGAQLPVHRQHPGRRQRDHREEHRAAARSACSPRRGRATRSSCSRARPSATRPSSSPATSPTRCRRRCAPRDFAVFYRTNAQSRVLEDALRARNLPYTVVGRHALLRSRRDQGPGRVHARGRQPRRRHGAAADHQRSGARHRRGDRRPDRRHHLRTEDPGLAGAGAGGARTSSCSGRGRARRSRRSSR